MMGREEDDTKIRESDKWKMKQWRRRLITGKKMSCTLGEQGELRGRCDKRGDYIGSMKGEQTKPMQRQKQEQEQEGERNHKVCASRSLEKKHLRKHSPWTGRCQIHWPAGGSRTGPGRWSRATGPRTAAGSGDLWGGGGANASVGSSRPRGSSGSPAETAGIATSCYGGQSGCRRSPPCFWGVFWQGSSSRRWRKGRVKGRQVEGRKKGEGGGKGGRGG